MVAKRDEVIVEVIKEREVKTYTELWHTSWCLLEQGREQERGCAHQFRASIVFTAFTMEAYLNHIGPQIFKCWDSIENLPPTKKLNIIAEKLNVQVDYGKHPWQVMKNLFSFRNTIAHGKSKMIKEEYCVSADDYNSEPLGLIKTGWEKKCTCQYAAKTRKDVENIIEKLHNAAGLADPFRHGGQSTSASRKK